jgi:xylulokinase
MRKVIHILTIDVGTGSVRAGLVGLDGRVRALNTVPHSTSYPRHGWAEQRPVDWWHGARKAIAATLAEAPGSEIAGVACCGQMHAPVLVDKTNAVVRETVPLWNDKRAADLTRELDGRFAAGPSPRPANPATSAWPGVKLAWMARNDPGALAAAHRLLMPKDWMNLQLCGEIAMDWTEAGSSFLSDPDTRNWSGGCAQVLGIDPRILPPLLPCDSVLGRITAQAAEETDLPEGLPVFVGAGDYPASILGSGVTRTGQVSDITGTSFLLTSMTESPILAPDVMNVATATPGWGAFAVVDAAGDAVRWASRALDRNMRGYEALSAEAASVGAGADGLVFLPYLTGERLGQGAGSRGAFLGLTAQHGSAHLHRSVMEGVVLAMREAYAPIAQVAGDPSSIVSAAGGARSDLLLSIKANVFDCPIEVTEEPEAGLIGTACLAFAGLGHFASPAEAASALVRYRAPIMPDLQIKDVYEGLATTYASIRRVMPDINAALGKRQ